MLSPYYMTALDATNGKYNRNLFYWGLPLWMTQTTGWIQFYFYQFWSPLLITEEARHSFSRTDQGSVGPTFSILCSVRGKKAQTKREKLWNLFMACYLLSGNDKSLKNTFGLFSSISGKFFLYFERLFSSTTNTNHICPTVDHAQNT